MSEQNDIEELKERIKELESSKSKNNILSVVYPILMILVHSFVFYFLLILSIEIEPNMRVIIISIFYSWVLFTIATHAHARFDIATKSIYKKGYWVLFNEVIRSKVNWILILLIINLNYTLGITANWISFLE